MEAAPVARAKTKAQALVEAQAEVEQLAAELAAAAAAGLQAAALTELATRLVGAQAVAAAQAAVAKAATKAKEPMPKAKDAAAKGKEAVPKSAAMRAKSQQQVATMPKEAAAKEPAPTAAQEPTPTRAKELSPTYVQLGKEETPKVAGARRSIGGQSECEPEMEPSRTPRTSLVAAAAMAGISNDPAWPLPPSSDNWDWPLSRHEKKARVLMIDDFDRRCLQQQLDSLLCE